MNDTLIHCSTTTTAVHDPKRKPLENTNHVRAYPHSPGCMALQIRSAGRVSNHGTVNRHCFSTALMSPEEVELLRDALNEYLRFGC